MMLCGVQGCIRKGLSDSAGPSWDTLSGSLQQPCKNSGLLEAMWKDLRRGTRSLRALVVCVSPSTDPTHRNEEPAGRPQS